MASKQRSFAELARCALGALLGTCLLLGCNSDGEGEGGTVAEHGLLSEALAVQQPADGGESARASPELRHFWGWALIQRSYTDRSTTEVMARPAKMSHMEFGLSTPPRSAGPKWA